MNCFKRSVKAEAVSRPWRSLPPPMPPPQAQVDHNNPVQFAPLATSNLPRSCNFIFFKISYRLTSLNISGLIFRPQFSSHVLQVQLSTSSCSALEYGFRIWGFDGVDGDPDTFPKDDVKSVSSGALGNEVNNRLNRECGLLGLSEIMISDVPRVATPVQRKIGKWAHFPHLWQARSSWKWNGFVHTARIAGGNGCLPCKVECTHWEPAAEHVNNFHRQIKCRRTGV